MSGHTIDSHFEKRAPVVRAIYDRILGVAGGFGPYTEAPKKTSIHLDRRSAFAGIRTNKDSLILTVKSPVEIVDDRIGKREQLSANRWYFEIKLRSPEEIDPQIVEWLRGGYEISG